MNLLKIPQLVKLGEYYYVSVQCTYCGITHFAWYQEPKYYKTVLNAILKAESLCDHKNKPNNPPSETKV
jgi:hypothetical protein